MTVQSTTDAYQILLSGLLIFFYFIFRVRLCDFIDDKNEKEEEDANCPSNNLALNLIQTEKTVDLSCKPKQRLKSNFNSSHCKDNSVSTYCDGSNEIKKVNQSFCTSTCSKSHSKNKHKKKGDNSESFNQYYDEDTGSDILDMSVNKVKKTSHDNCFLPSEDCLSNPYIINDKLNCEEEYKISKKKHKKRKRQPDFPIEDFTVSNSIESLSSNEFVSNVKKSKKSFKSEDVLENNYKRASNVKCSDKKSKTYKTNKKCKNLQFEKKDVQPIQIDCSSNTLNNSNYTEDGYDSEKRLSEKKKLYQNHIDALLDNKTNFSSAQVLFENGGGLSTNYTVSMGEHKDLQNSSFCNHVVSQNEDRTSLSGDQNVQSLLESSNTKVKRKRVRRHRKNKKSLYLEAVGPVLQNITEQNEVYKSSTSAKHIYFGDKDCNEKTMVDNTISSSLETSMQGKYLVIKFYAQ